MSDVRTLPIALIDADDRLRPVDMQRAAAIAESMAVVGQLEAVLVRPHGDRFILVIGGHRLAGAKINGWTEIETKVEELTPLRARLKEIDENLYRHELTALDRAVFLAERKRVWEELNPQTAHGGDRKSLKKQGGNQVATMATRFSSEASEALNISERTIQRACLVAGQLSPDVIAIVRKTYLATHQGDLEKLARLAPAKQLETAQRLASRECSTLAGAFGRTERAPEDKQFEAFTKIWGQAGAKTRRRMLTFVGLTPGEIQRVLGRPKAVSDSDEAA